MRYRYIAAQPDGKMTDGEIDAGSASQVLSWMMGQGYKPISIKAITTEKKNKRQLFASKITLADKVFLVKYLGLMLKVGTDLFRAIDILVSDLDKPALKSFLVEVRTSLSQGKPFHTTFAQYPQYFSPVIINLIKSGERSGNLEAVLYNISINLEKDQALHNQVKAALIYPIILIGIATLVIIFMVVFVLPRIANIFIQSGIEPPLFSRIVFSIGLFMNAHIYIIIPFFIGFGFMVRYLLFQHKTGSQLRERIIARLPIVSTMVQQLAIQQFTSTFSSLLKAGIPVVEALEITASAVNSDELKNTLIRIAKEGITRGLTIGEAFRREAYFPRIVTNLITISEKAGHMEVTLETLSDFYTKEVNASVKIFVAFLEPALLLALGLIVGLIMISIIIPITQMITAV